ncbi:PQQ-dependent sugar dehydrogenase [Sphingobacterium bovistauri]|uniref:PQQ-dependent sugar dehydrogenase n=1 Tax=Sphingobacterium bovistauri TaxID=2781959 RepID=A0ABS7Z8Q1_9SPHI|nr:PQQ-dependent sugar dehydrogenase [Sphingobacterium bovistauri]MCA5006378.1 PQQ-dependent sugar dehydrogenase [Sphingobacterium bovistauri]
MKNLIITGSLVSSILLCTSNTLSYDTKNVIDTIAPVERNKANAAYKPSFKGQTRVSGVKTKTLYETKVIAKGLKSPWGIAVMPDGRLLITEKEGVLRLVNSSGHIGEAITGLPKVDFRAQGGLLGLVLDPQFSKNNTLYWAYSEPGANGNHTAVAKGKLSKDGKKIENPTVIYRSTHSHKGALHYGGRLVFDKSGNLLVTIGERSDRSTRVLAQDLKSSLGKIIRITKDGKPASGNPFIGNKSVLPEIYSYGHRNPQGIAFNPLNGTLWSSEFGPRGGDELNLIQTGKNYGWPVITYGIEYSGKPIGEPIIQAKKGMEQPIYYWDPVLSPSGMTFYSGKGIPEWKNNLFIAGLSSTHIARLVLRNNRVIGEERLLSREAERFRDVVEGKNGELYTITDAGKIYVIRKK